MMMSCSLFMGAYCAGGAAAGQNEPQLGLALVRPERLWYKGAVHKYLPRLRGARQQVPEPCAATNAKCIMSQSYTHARTYTLTRTHAHTHTAAGARRGAARRSGAPMMSKNPPTTCKQHKAHKTLALAPTMSS